MKYCIHFSAMDNGKTQCVLTFDDSKCQLEAYVDGVMVLVKAKNKLRMLFVYIGYGMKYLAIALLAVGLITMKIHMQHKLNKLVMSMMNMFSNDKSALISFVGFMIVCET